MVPLSLTYSIRKVDGLPALRLLFCCCWVATWLCCCNCRLWLQQHTAVQGLQKAFKQDKADDGNAMHKSKDSAEECFPPCCWCSIMTTGTSHYWGKTRSSILKRISPVERNIVRWNRRLDWNAQLLQTNVIWTVLKKSHIFLSKHALLCWKFEYKQSLLPNNLKWIQLYSSHLVVCPTSYIAEGQTQWLLLLYSDNVHIVHTLIQFFLI